MEAAYIEPAHADPVALVQAAAVASPPAAELTPVQAAPVEAAPLASGAQTATEAELADVAAVSQVRAPATDIVEPGDESAAQATSAEAHAVPEPAPDFNSSGSDMPVVLNTPLPRVSKRRARGLAQVWRRRQAWLSHAQGWSRKTERVAPRALILSAPFIAVFGIWLAHSLVVRHRHAAVQPARAAALQLEVTTPPILEPAAAQQPAPALLTSVTPATSGEASTATAIASPAELMHALTRGLPALEALSAKYPADAQVAIALGSQEARAQRYDSAVAAVQHALSVDPTSAQNGKVMSILWRAAQSSASEQSFSALHKLGSRGTDISFDLATTPGVRNSVRERAKTELSNFLAFDASPDTRVATALLLAPDCTARKALLERAESDGGARTLSLLERFSRGACAASAEGSCNSCLIGNPALAQALSKLNSGSKP